MRRPITKNAIVWISVMTVIVLASSPLVAQQKTPQVGEGLQSVPRGPTKTYQQSMNFNREETRAIQQFLLEHGGGFGFDVGGFSNLLEKLRTDGVEVEPACCEWRCSQRPDGTSDCIIMCREC